MRRRTPLVLFFDGIGILESWESRVIDYHKQSVKRWFTNLPIYQSLIPRSRCLWVLTTRACVWVGSKGAGRGRKRKGKHREGGGSHRPRQARLVARWEGHARSIGNSRSTVQASNDDQIYNHPPPHPPTKARIYPESSFLSSYGSPLIHPPCSRIVPVPFGRKVPLKPSREVNTVTGH